MSRVPPSTWTRRWKKSPQQILQAAFNTEVYGERLITALINATVLHHDPDWAEALLIYNLEKLTAYTPQYLITFVPQHKRERVVENALSAPLNLHPIRGLPAYFFWWLGKPWSKHFSSFILNHLTYYANPATPENSDIIPTISLIAEGIHPAIYPEAQSHLGPPNPIHPYLAEPITALLTTLKSRYEQTPEQPS